MQSLYEWDFRGRKQENLPGIIDRNVKEFAAGLEDTTFVSQLVDGVMKHLSELDKIIEKAAPQWPLEQIAVVDRNVLRLGLYELLFGNREEVPPKVAINESIELAKSFGGDSSGKFVNGVLGAVYKEMGEPGKDDAPRKKRVPGAPIDLSKLPVEKLCGTVVYAKDKDEVYLALVHDIFGHWTLSKGHIEAGDTEEVGVVKETLEELGINIIIKEKLGENEYVASDPEKGKIRKHVVYFLTETPFSDLKLKKSGGLDDARWFRLADILDLNIYDDILPIITKAINILLKK